MKKEYSGTITVFFRIESDSEENVYDRIERDLKDDDYDIRLIDIDEVNEIEPEDTYGN